MSWAIKRRALLKFFNSDLDNRPLKVCLGRYRFHHNNITKWDFSKGDWKCCILFDLLGILGLKMVHLV